MNRFAMSASSACSSTSERFSTVTEVPNAEKTWANSAAMYPPPMMIIDCGSSASLITVSEVWKSTERQPRQIGDHRTAAGRNHHLVGGDRLRRANVQLPRPDEACARVENGDIVASLRDRPVPSAAMGSIRPKIRSRISRHRTSRKIQIDPEPCCLNRRAGKIGRVNEHLAGNAANIEAGPAEGSHLDQRNAEVVEPVVDDRISGSGADDAEVKVPHPAIVPAQPLALLFGSACRAPENGTTIRRWVAQASAAG